jgi:hypothetical protein
MWKEKEANSHSCIVNHFIIIWLICIKILHVLKTQMRFLFKYHLWNLKLYKLLRLRKINPKGLPLISGHRMTTSINKRGPTLAHTETHCFKIPQLPQTVALFLINPLLLRQQTVKPIIFDTSLQQCIFLIYSTFHSDIEPFYRVPSI